MSLRSNELFVAATRRLRTAHAAAADGDPSAAISLAYYAMLYAARAALSERDIGPRTHRGTWLEFTRTFVDEGAIDVELARAAQQAQPERERADYEAWEASAADAERVMATTERFLAAVGDLLD